MKKLLLLTFTLICMLFPQNSAQATDVNSVKAMIVKHALEMGVDPAIALSIARTESGFRHEARSPYGAIGVYQLMPSTAKRLGVNPYSLNDNIIGGIMYYKMMYRMFGSVELALAAYNAGPGNVKKYNNAVPPFAETRRFVAKIMADYNRQKTNPDPAVLNARVPKPAVSATPKVPAPVPEIKVQDTQEEIQTEIFDDLPVELEIKAKAVAI